MNLLVTIRSNGCTDFYDPWEKRSSSSEAHNCTDSAWGPFPDLAEKAWVEKEHGILTGLKWKKLKYRPFKTIGICAASYWRGGRNVWRRAKVIHECPKSLCWWLVQDYHYNRVAGLEFRTEQTHRGQTEMENTGDLAHQKGEISLTPCEPLRYAAETTEIKSLRSKKHASE